MNDIRFQLPNRMPAMQLACQVNQTERTIDLIVLANGAPVPMGGVRFTLQQAKEHMAGLAQAITYLEQQSQSKLILPPGVGRPFQPS